MLRMFGGISPTVSLKLYPGFQRIFFSDIDMAKRGAETASARRN